MDIGELQKLGALLNALSIQTAHSVAPALTVFVLIHASALVIQLLNVKLFRIIQIANAHLDIQEVLLQDALQVSIRK